MKTFPVTIAQKIEDYTEQLPFLVYGTLRQGYGNSRLFGNGIKKVRVVKVGGIGLYSRPDSVPYAFPFEDAVLVGELVYINEDAYPDTLRRVDNLEGFDYKAVNGWNHYDRLRVTFTDDQGEEISAWVYVSSVDPAVDRWVIPHVIDGDWSKNNERVPAGALRY